ncbi:MAG: hypothetical protein Q4G62_06375 [Pseudomonadota bacterium]|nr:hypothetical protein [Pseudomonadota bacterium]
MSAEAPFSSPSHPVQVELRDLELRLAVYADLLVAGSAGDALVRNLLIRVFNTLNADDTAHAVRMRAWRALLDAPGVRIAPWPKTDAGLQPLARLAPTRRALALLHLQSGANALELAALLRAQPAGCRAELTRLIDELGGEAGLQAARFSLHKRMQALPIKRRVALAAWRDRRNKDETPLPWQHAESASSKKRGWAMALVATLTALALAATWGWSSMLDEDGDGDPHIRSRELKLVEPASRFDADAAIALHPDRALLEIPPGDAAIARDAAFYAWYQAERLGISSYEPAAPTEEAPEGESSGLPEPIDAP